MNLEGIPNVLNLLSHNVNMRTIAKIFDVGVENNLPCFIILDPNKPDFFVTKKVVTDNTNIFLQVYNIIGELYDVECDIQQYAQQYREPYYRLTARNLLERNLKSIKYGIDVEELKETIRDEKLNKYFDLEVIDRLSINGFIPTTTFLENLKAIKYTDIDNEKDLEKSALVTLLDKYTSFYNSKKPKSTMLFREIKDYIEPSSIDYLATASMFKKGSLKELDISPSMAAICLGKVVEDELNLGIFNVFRGAFSVILPDNFNKVQDGLGNIEVTFNKCKNKIYFNKSDHQNVHKLEYPITSDLRKIAFGNHCSPDENSDASINALRAKKDIDDIKRALHVNKNWSDIFTKLKIIAENRNEAIHRAQPLTKEELKKSIDAFKDLIDLQFFEVNDKMKKIKRNRS